jgi:hypothetical protein
MIGGSSVTDSVRASARELLGWSASPASSLGGTRPTRFDGVGRLPTRDETPRAAGPAKDKTKAKGESESRWRRST